MIKRKAREANIRIYIIPFVIITLFFIMITFIMRTSIKNYFYDLKKKEAMKIAKSISIDLSHTGQAVDTINSLLEKKLINSLKATSLNFEEFSNEHLVELADAFELDEISVYTNEGKIIYSNISNFVGWKPGNLHPVRRFMSGNDDIFIEDIRQDSVSGEYKKFGYMKLSDGFIIQIGILAEKVHDLLEPVRLQNLLEEMIADTSIIKLFALDEDYNISASTDIGSIGSSIKDEEIITYIKNGNIYDHINNTSDVESYKIFIPIEYESEKIIAFGIEYSLNEVFPVIKKNTIIGVSGLLIVYISLLLSVVSTYKRDKRLNQLAYYDGLTGLPNTELLKQRLNEDMIKNNKNKAIFMIRCGNIKLINQTFGYEYGDMAVKEIGGRFKTLVCRDMQLFRFSGENFVLYIKNYEQKEELLYILEKIEGLFNKPLLIKDVSEHLDIQIGIKEYIDTDKSLDQLLKEATIALNFMSNTKDKNYCFFDDDMELNIRREKIIETGLGTAIRENDTSIIYLVYQPIIDSKYNRIEGFEALARMNSEEFGFISPVEFIDIAERKQLIIPLSNHILRTACSFLADLLKLGTYDLRVAVNISTIHILQDDFVSTVLDIIKDTGINGRNLELEITETIIMGNFEIINTKLKELRESGIHISIDDFGTGYSSFARLKELNVDNLKIDQYFIQNITDENSDLLITRDIISIAHRLGLKTIAEGVELQIQKDYLLENGCDKLQGYLFSKPVPEDEAVELLKKYNNEPQPSN